MEFQLIIGNFRLASPFIAIGAGLVFISLLWILLRKRERALHSHLELWGKNKFGQKNILVKGIPVFAVITLFSLLVAIVQPQIVRIEKKPIQARDFIAVLDESGSMRIAFETVVDSRELLPDDFDKTRLAAAERALRSFVEKRTGDRFALIFYDEEANIARRFTDNNSQIQNALLQLKEEAVLVQFKEEDWTLGFGGGTDTPKALELARGYFEQASVAKNRILILVSDFDDEPYELASALKQTKAEGIRIYLIGIATNRYQQRLGKFKEKIQEIGVRIFSVEQRSDLALAYQLISELEKSEVQETAVFSQSLSWIFIITAFISFVIFLILAEIFRKIP